jgi:lysophospholipase L1-like esterase
MAIKKSRLAGFLACMAVIALLAGYAYHHEAQRLPLYQQNSNYALQIGMYDLFRTTQADVVMLGNSLTYNANWNELLGRKNIVNRGIISDVTEGYLHRLQYVYQLQPRICFIEGGVNDVFANLSADEAFRNITAIVDTLRSHGIIPVIQSTLFVAPNWKRAAESNPEVARLDRLLADYCSRQKIEYLDINSVLIKNGFLKDELTCDGVHLNAAGYRLWVPEVERILIKYGL